jgi:hypothetical protein
MLRRLWTFACDLRTSHFLHRLHHDIVEEMPSPLGHLLGGLVVGSFTSRRPVWPVIAACSLAAALPDVDILLPIAHRGPTHSLAAAAIAYGGTLLVLRGSSWRRDRVRLASAIALGVLSHTLLDWLGADSSRPRGVMALWPVSTAYYISNLDIFGAVDRRYWLPGFWQRNIAALARELAILVPLTWLAIRRVKPGKRN